MLRLLIMDVTQMREGRLCVTGLDEQLECVRLVLPYPGIRRNHLYKETQVVIRPRAVVKVQAEPDFRARTPHIEDHQWLDPEQTEGEYLVEDKQWEYVLSRTAYPSVQAIFEADLIKNRKLAVGTGKRSAGTLIPKAIANVNYDEDPYNEGEFRCRLSFRDQTGEFFAFFPVVDLSLLRYADYLRLHKQMSVEKVSEFLKHVFRQADRVWLRLGLTRPWGRDKGGSLHSYIQVLGIHTLPDYLRGKCFADFEALNDQHFI